MFRLSTLLALVAVASLSSVVQAAVPVWPMGQQRSGSYTAGGDSIRFVAIHYRGKFDLPSIREAFNQAVAGNRRLNQTACRDKSVKNNDKYGNQRERLASDRHAVLGWINERSGEFFYVGVTIDSNGKRYSYLTRNGIYGTGGGSFKDWQYRTNGYEVWMHFADDDNHGVAWRFRGPK